MLICQLELSVKLLMKEVEAKEKRTGFLQQNSAAVCAELRIVSGSEAKQYRSIVL